MPYSIGTTSAQHFSNIELTAFFAVVSFGHRILFYFLNLAVGRLFDILVYYNFAISKCLDYSRTRVLHTRDHTVDSGL